MAILQTTNVPVGSAGTPSLSFTGFTDDGIYHPADNQVAVVTAGTARLTVTDSTITSPLNPSGANSVAVRDGAGRLQAVDPAASSDLVTLSYLTSYIAGARDPKESVRVATTAAGTLASSFENGDTIDGVVLATGNRILIKDQASGAENGIYTVNASGAPTRATDADTSAEVTAGMFCWVMEGTANADSGWLLTTNDTIVLDTTALVFTQVSGLGQITAGAGLTKTGNTLDVVGDASITVNADNITRAALTGDVTASAGSNATTIAANAVTNTKLRDSGALSVIGRSANSSGDPADISTTAASGAVLRESGSTIGFGTIATAGITDDAVTNPKLANMADSTVKGRAVGAGTGDPTDLTAAQLVTIINTADGAGSGLDADTLDGINSTGFLRTTGENQATAPINFADATGFLINLGALTTTGIKWDTTANQIQFQDAGTTRAYVDLDNGELSATSIVETSDERLKNNITNIDGAKALKQVKKMQGVYFNRNDTGLREVGLIAQRVQALEPMLVQEGQDGYLSVNYTRIVALLIEAVKEQQEQIDTLRQELDNKI